MSVPDNYEINIAEKTDKHPNGVHWGKLEISTYDEIEAEEKLKIVREIFGDKYRVSMTHWVCRGQVKDEWR